MVHSIKQFRSTGQQRAGNASLALPKGFASSGIRWRRSPRGTRSCEKCLILLVARQPPYEAAFLEGFLGLIKMLIQRVPTKIPTKLPRERRSVRRPYAQSPAALWSSIASDRTTKVARSLSVGKVFFEGDPARATRLSVPRRAVGQSCISAQISSDARDRPGFHPIRSGAEAVP